MRWGEKKMIKKAPAEKVKLSHVPSVFQLALAARGIRSTC